MFRPCYKVELKEITHFFYNSIFNIKSYVFPFKAWRNISNTFVSFPAVFALLYVKEACVADVWDRVF